LCKKEGNGKGGCVKKGETGKRVVMSNNPLPGLPPGGEEHISDKNENE